MNNWLEKIKSQIQQLWHNTSNGKKTVAGISLLIFLIIVGYGIQTATQPDYKTLFTGLGVQDAGAIASKLKESKIPYQLTNNGTTVLVPSKNLDQTRLDLATQGLPTGGVVGFESFDTTNFGETDTQQRAKYQRALQGELTRTIIQLAEVDNARVHIVMPEPALFSEDQKETTASVMLKLKAYKKLTPDQVTGLVRLLSSSVEGLKPQNVTILDTNGNDLTDGIALDDTSSGNKLTADQLAIQKSMQTDLEKSAQSMLEKVMGPGKAVVRVSAELDFDQVQTHKENWGDNVPRSQQVIDESSKGQNSNPQGVPGTTSNGSSTPTYQTGNNGNSSNEYNKSEKITNYEINKTEENRVAAQGVVKRLTVAVVVDGKQITSKDQAAIQAAVSNAVGLNKSRGDVISVTTMPFNTTYQDEFKQAMAQEDKRQQWLTYGKIAAGVIGAFVLLLILRRRNSEDETPVMTVKDMMANAELAATKEPQLSPEERQRVKTYEEVEILAKKDPDSVAQLLKTWLADE